MKQHFVATAFIIIQYLVNDNSVGENDANIMPPGDIIDINNGGRHSRLIMH